MLRWFIRKLLYTERLYKAVFVEPICILESTPFLQMEFLPESNSGLRILHITWRFIECECDTEISRTISGITDIVQLTDPSKNDILKKNHIVCFSVH